MWIGRILSTIELKYNVIIYKQLCNNYCVESCVNLTGVWFKILNFDKNITGT